MAMLNLMNGSDDNLISFPESLAIAAAVPEAQARVLLIQSVLGQVRSECCQSALVALLVRGSALPEAAGA